MDLTQLYILLKTELFGFIFVFFFLQLDQLFGNQKRICIAHTTVFQSR